MKRIFFFATPSDVVPVLVRFASNDEIKFVEMGNLTTPNRPIHLSVSEIPDPGLSTHETGGASRSYLISPRDSINQMHKFLGNDGIARWSVDNSDNEDSVVLTMAGRWKDMLLPGSMDTLHQTTMAQRLMKAFQSALKKEGFVKVENWWLGKEALEMLKAGKRLSTTAEQSPPQFDLVLPNKFQTQ